MNDDPAPAHAGAGLRATRLRLRLACAVTAAALFVLSAPPSSAGNPALQRLDQERALAERGRGSIVPLERLVQAIAQQIPGRQIDVELEEDDGLLVYEIKWLLPDGRRIEIEVDARDGHWLAVKGSRLETVFRRPASGGARP